MDREVKFAWTLEQVLRKAKEQGNCIGVEQVEEAFRDFGLDGEQLQMVYDYLEKHQVGIGEPPDPDQYLTDGERNYLQDYLDELALLPRVTEGEKEAYTISAMAGDAQAQRKLAEVYLPEVAEIARLYAGQGVYLEDLIGEGNLALTMGAGMLGCLEKPSEAQGMLVRMIMDSMEEYIAENAENVRTDRKVLEKVNLVTEKARELAGDLQRKVTPQELAEETGLSREDVLEAVRMSGFHIEYIEVPRDV